MRFQPRALLMATALAALAAPAAALPPTGVAPVDEVVDAVPPPDSSTEEASAGGVSRPAAEGQELRGTFRIRSGSCGEGGVDSGSYFRMITPSGQVGRGPYVNNSSSSCGDNTWTTLLPGKDGGLSTDGYQPHPDPAFDEQGNALADLIIKPQGFNGARFSIATSPVDPQTSREVPIPTVSTQGGKLSGNLSAWAAAWNEQHFNQGAPKPDGSNPGNTAGPTGTYDPATGAYVLEWSSQIVGGPFNNFTGFWHLEGTFAPAAGAQRAGTPPTTGPSAASSSGTPATVAGATEAAPAGSGRMPRTGGPMPAAGALLTLAGLAGFRVARTRSARP